MVPMTDNTISLDTSGPGRFAGMTAHFVRRLCLEHHPETASGISGDLSCLLRSYRIPMVMSERLSLESLSLELSEARFLIELLVIFEARAF
jgi:hypothetical protein